MPLPLRNLDDRRWADLVEEGRTLLPLFARREPRWTDHNIHDPGVTLIELFAWLAEMDIHQLSRVPEHHRRKFLALIGYSPRPPQAARTLLSFQLKDGASPLALPAGVEVETPPLAGLDPRFRTLKGLTAVPLAIGAVLVDDGHGLHDRTRQVGEGLPTPVFGEDPWPDPDKGRPAFYLGLRAPLPSGVPVTFYLRFAGPGTGEETRQRLWQEARRLQAACQRPPPAPCTPEPPPDECCRELEGGAEEGRPGSIPASAARQPVDDRLPPHHSAQIVWEIYASDAAPTPGEGRWQPAGEVVDDTRCLTLDGAVQITLPDALVPRPLQQGPVRQPLYYLRCRFLAGQYDAPPTLVDLLPNSTEAEQAFPAGQWELAIAAGVQPDGPPPQPGQTTRLRIHWKEAGTATALSFEPGAPDLPDVTVLAYTAPTYSQPGKLTLELEALGTGQGRPHQVFHLLETKIQGGSLRLFTLEQKEAGAEETTWREWAERADLDASSRTDLHFTLDADTGEITAGSGDRGRLFPPGATVLASYRATVARLGNLDRGKITRLAQTAHNRALLGDLRRVQDALAQITNPLAAVGGAETESLEHATGRAMEVLWAHERLHELCDRFACGSLDQIPRGEILAVKAPQRAVSLIDFERLALDAPGTQVARARAWADLHPAYPCLKAPGVITVVIMPSLPARRPQPSPGLLEAVRRYLHPRRTLTTRVEVVGPTYLEVGVRAKVQARAGASPGRVREDILRALDRFLAPRAANGDQPGWPFGRDVFRSEVLQIIDGIDGVDYVQSLELLPGTGEPQCGNLSVCPTWLVAPGKHEIEVLRGT